MGVRVREPQTNSQRRYSNIIDESAVRGNGMQTRTKTEWETNGSEKERKKEREPKEPGKPRNRRAIRPKSGESSYCRDWGVGALEADRAV